jgi:voltage-gated sodium channel
MVLFCKELSESKAFQWFITSVILLAGLLVGLETYPELVKKHTFLFHLLDKVILVIFISEIVIKIVAEGNDPLSYFKDTWNIFDFAIVAIALMPIDSQFVTVARLVRLLRILRLFKAIPKLQMLVGALLKSIPSMFYVAVLLMILLYIYGVAGVFLFGQNDPVNFGSLGPSFLSLFRIITLENWDEIFFVEVRGCNKHGYEGDLAQYCTSPDPSPTAAVFFFISFILLGTMIMLNLFIGVIVKGMEEIQDEEDQENDLLEENSEGYPAYLQKELQKLSTQISFIQKELISMRTYNHSLPNPGKEKAEDEVVIFDLSKPGGFKE